VALVEAEKAAAKAAAMVAVARVLAARVVAARVMGSREAEGCILEYPGSSSARAGAAAAAGVDAAAGMVAGMAAAVREGEGDVEAEDLLGRSLHEPLDHPHHVFGGDKRHLDVELRELRLTVGTQVLIAEAAGDLVVALEATHHEQLLEQLRALRQRVPVALAEA
jgi:hypothetical protein